MYNVSSPQGYNSSRDLVRPEQPLRRPKPRRFNSKFFHREKPEDAYNGDSHFNLHAQELPYTHKRDRITVIRATSFRLALTNALLAVVVILCAYLDNELTFYATVAPSLSVVLRSVVVAASLLQVGVTVKYAECRLRERKVAGKLHPKSET